MLEQAINAEGKPYSLIRKDADFPFAANNKLLVKVHGDLEEGNMILREEDYLEYQNRNPLFTAYLQSVFATNVVLFIGYSFSDDDLKAIIQRVQSILGSSNQMAFLLDN